jgi:hydroxypyruvate reductase
MMTASSRETAREIFLSAVQAVAPERLIHSNVHRQRDILKVVEKTFSLSQFERIIVVGGGKASGAMAAALEEILFDKIAEGVIVVKHGHTVPLKRVRLVEAGHPLPDGNGVQGANEILRLLSETTERDLVFCLLSGGGSALLPAFQEGISLEDAQRTFHLLLSCGARIQEMNIVRKHLSRIGGGQLARAAFPATIVALVLSDVVGDSLETIASGPTVSDSSTFAEAVAVIEHYGLSEKLPPAVWNHLRKGVAGKIPETPKADDDIFSRTHTHIVGNNASALRAAAEKATSLGYTVEVFSSCLEGESREVACDFVQRACELQRDQEFAKPLCLLAGGETTVTLKGNGLGGRNQEFALSAAIALDSIEGITVLSCGTDGTDGPTDAAGAVADGATCKRARDFSLNAADCLERNDSYHFFKALGDLVITGPTLTNVMDIVVGIVT